MLRLVLFILLLWRSEFVHAANISVGVDETDYLPYYRATSGNIFQGFGRELLDQFAKDSGHSFLYQALPVNRLARDCAQGKIELRFPDSPLWGGDQKQNLEMHYTDPIVRYTDGISIIKGRVIPANAMPTFSMIRGWTPFPFLELRKEKKVQFVEVSDLRAGLSMLSNQRVHGIYGNSAVMQYYGKKYFQWDLVLNKDLPHSTDDYRISTVGKARIKVIEEFNLWLKNNQLFVKNLKLKHGLVLN